MVDEVDKLVSDSSRVSKNSNTLSKASFDIHELDKIPKIGRIKELIEWDVGKYCEEIKNRARFNLEGVSAYSFEVMVEGRIENVSEKDFNTVRKMLAEKGYWFVKFKKTGEGVGVVEYEGHV
jgi:hypothetical protein